MRQRINFVSRAAIVVAPGVALPTSLFVILQSVVLTSLPLPHGERVAVLFSKRPSTRSPISGPNVRDLVSGLNGVEAVGAFITGVWTSSVRMDGSVAYLSSAEFDSGVLGLLGVRPLLGRWPAEEELKAPPSRLVLVSERLWLARLHGDPEAIGKEILGASQPLTVVGVLPALKVFSQLTGQEPDLIFPCPVSLSWYGRGARGYQALLRLEPNEPLARIRAELSVKANQLLASYPRDTKLLDPDVISLRSAVLGHTEGLIWLLFAATGVVWLIAAGNFGALLAVRLEERHGDLALRAALGAGRRHLLNQVVREVLPSAIAGAVVGGSCAWVVVPLLRSRAEVFGMPGLEDSPP